MGYIKHNSIIVCGWDKAKLNQTRNKAIEIFEESFKEESDGVVPYGGKLISEIVDGVVNSFCSFFISPDGSKEGWGDSECGDIARKTFLDWLQNDENNYSDYIEVIFGGDDENCKILRDRDSDLDNKYK